MKKLLVASMIAMTALSANASLHPGQIIARDLDLPGAEFLGHVGLGYWNNNGKPDGNLPTDNIIHIHYGQPEKKTIQINKFITFYNPGSFWGAKWGIIESNYMQGVLGYAKDQMRFGAKYIFAPSSTRSGYNDKHGKAQPARFRCDTFVQWAYEQGGNYNFRLPLSAITPEILFSKFPRFNTSVPHRSIAPEIHEETDKAVENMNMFEFGNYMDQIKSKGEDYLKSLAKKLPQEKSFELERFIASLNPSIEKIKSYIAEYDNAKSDYEKKLAFAKLIMIEGELDTDESYEVYKDFYAKNYLKDNSVNKYDLLFGHINSSQISSIDDNEEQKIFARILEIYPDNDVARYSSIAELAFKSKDQRGVLNKALELAGDNEEYTLETIEQTAFFARHFKKGFSPELKVFLRDFIQMEKEKQSLTENFRMSESLNEISSVIGA